MRPGDPTQLHGDSASVSCAWKPLFDCSGTENPDADFCGMPFAFCPIRTSAAWSFGPVAQFWSAQT